MAIREVRSPNNREGMTPNSERRIGVSPLSSRRSDGFGSGHIAPHVGKNALRHTQPTSLAHDLEQSSAGTGNKVIPPVKP
jgi:hypothetical protein